MKIPKRFRSKLTQTRKGAFTVEFALVSSIFFMVLTASFEFSRIYYARHCLDQASYEAARVGIVQGATAAEVENRARGILAAAGVKPLSVTVNPSVFTETTQTVTVTVTCNVTDNSWIPGRFFMEPIISGTTTLDHENQSYLLRPDSGNQVGDNDNEPIDV